jgi:hypothetical protein
VVATSVAAVPMPAAAGVVAVPMPAAAGVVAVPMPTAASSSVVALPIQLPTASSRVAPSPSLTASSRMAPSPSPTANSRMTPSQSPKGRTSVADRWAKRMAKTTQGSPQGSVVATPGKQPSESTHPATDDIVSEPSVETVEHAPASAVPAAIPVPANSDSRSTAASSDRGKVANRWGKRLGERQPDTEVPVEDIDSTPDPADDEAQSDPIDNAPVPVASVSAPAVVPSSSPPVKALSPADQWAKRLRERNLEIAVSAEEQMSSSGHPDEAPAPFAFKLKPGIANKRPVMPEASDPSPSEPTTEFASRPSKRGNVLSRWPIPSNNVAKRWTTNTNPPESPTRALRSQSPDVDSMQHSENFLKQADTAEDFPSEESVKSVAAKEEKEIPQTIESRAVSTVDNARPTTFAAPKPASFIFGNNGHNNSPKNSRPANFSKLLKPPRKNELPSLQVDSVEKEGASFPAFDSWGAGVKQGDVDSDVSSNASRSELARLKKKNLKRMAQKHVSKGIAHKLADSSFTNDDDSTHPGDLSTAGDSVDAKEDRADQEQGEKVLATLLSSSKAATPKPKPSPEKKPNSPPPIVVSGKSPRSNKLVVETVMETISGAPNQEQQLPREDEDEDLTPRTKMVVESLRQKKKRLQLQRRKMKTGQSFDSATLASASASSFNSADTGYEQVTPGGASFEEKGISSSSSMPYRDTGPEGNDDLLPIDENAEDFAAHRTNESTFPSAYTTLHVSDSTSIRRGVLSPKSEGGQSDGGFSFYSAASSAHTGLSRNSSGSKNSFLANRAEKVVQERRQKWKARGSKEDKERATELARKVLNGPQNAVAQRMKGEENDNYNAISSSSMRQNDKSLIMEPSDARARAKREGLSTRYNTSSRFIDTDPSYGGAFAQPEGFVGRKNNSFSTAESVDSSEFRSVGSGTTESEGEARAARRRAKKKYAKERARAKSKPNNISNGVVSDQFVSESTANVEAFKSAYEAVSLGQMAADLADEVSLSVKGGGFDFQKIATDVNDSFRKYCGIQPSNSVPFDEAAVQDINTEDEDDPKGDLGACGAEIDDAMECSSPGKSKWDKHSMAPAGQPSFEGLATLSRKGIRAAYV